MSKGKLLVISGPSGVGKGTIVKRVMSERKNCALSISCTTRPPREGEREGISYFFVTRERFVRMIEEGGLIEYSEHFSHLYGTPKFFVEQKLAQGCDVILEIEVDGALQVKKAYNEAILVMITPPDMDELYSRLVGRGTETEEKIAKRLERADYELSKSPLYDYVIVNDELDKAVEQVVKILEQGDNR